MRLPGAAGDGSGIVERRVPPTFAHGGDELVSPDDRLKPVAAPATGFSLSSGLERLG